MKDRPPNACLPCFFWGILALIVAGVYVNAFILPNLEAGWRAQGIRELTWPWQLTVDGADLSAHRGLWAIPFLIPLAIVFTIRSLKANKDS